MKIAVSAEGKDLQSKVDPRFGRAAYFIIYNTDDNTFEAVSNDDNAQAAQGAGVQAAQTVAARRVDWVVSGNMGPKAFAGLKTAKIKIACWSEGTVDEAVKLVMDNKLEELPEANVRGHWS